MPNAGHKRITRDEYEPSQLVDFGFIRIPFTASARGFVCNTFPRRTGSLLFFSPYTGRVMDVRRPSATASWSARGIEKAVNVRDAKRRNENVILKTKTVTWR